MTGQEIYEYRRSRKVRQDVLASRLGLNLGALTDIERGRVVVAEETSRDIIRAIDEAAEEKQAATA